MNTNSNDIATDERDVIHVDNASGSDYNEIVEEENMERRIVQNSKQKWSFTRRKYSFGFHFEEKHQC